jgi:Predicted transcriptional regulator
MSRNENENRLNWHRADIVAAIKENTSLAELSRRHGYASGTAKNALDKHYPAGESIIANALGLQPQDIWPERYK